MVVIGLGAPEQAAMFCEQRKVPFTCLVQPDRSAHKAYGLRRGTFNQTAGPAVWAPWLKAELTGKGQGKFGQGDVAQLAGTFVVDTGGTVRYAFRAERSSEFPKNEEVLAALAGGSGGVARGRASGTRHLPASGPPGGGVPR